VIGRQPSSGTSVRAWCRRHALRESSFYWWRTQLARRDAKAPAFVPVRVTADRSATDAFDLPAGIGPASRIEIVLPRGRRVHVIGPVDRQALADVLAVLTAASGGEAEAAAC
jgi:hypothetical protein